MKTMRKPNEPEYVEVIYDDSNGVSKKSYTYRTMLDLRLGQKVICPTYRNPRQVATVTAVNCPEPGFRCKEIVEVMPETEGE